MSGPIEDPVLDLDRQAAALAAHPRVDDREHHALGQVLHGAHQCEAARAHVEGRYVMGDVDDARRGSMSRITAWQTPTNSSSRP